MPNSIMFFLFRIMVSFMCGMLKLFLAPRLSLIVNLEVVGIIVSDNTLCAVWYNMWSKKKVVQFIF